MSLRVIVEKRNTKMPHTGFPQWARALTAEKADRPLFNHRGKDHLPSCTPQDKLLDVGLEGAWLLLWLRVTIPPPSAEGVEGAGTPSTDSVQILQDFKLAGLCIGPGSPQELVSSRAVVRHLPVFQVPLPHPHLGQQLPGIPIHVVLPPRTPPSC